MRAVIFDLDGTLLQSMAIDCELFERAVETVVGPIRFRDAYSDYTHVTDAGIVAELLADNGRHRDPKIVDAVRAEFVVRLSSHIGRSGPFEEIPGASGFLDRLRCDADTRLAIATGGWGESARLKLRSSGINTDDIAIATCDDSPARTEIMRAALWKLGGQIDSVTYFGDGVWDIEACHQLGWNFVAVGAKLGGLTSYDGFSL